MRKLLIPVLAATVFAALAPTAASDANDRAGDAVKKNAGSVLTLRTRLDGLPKRTLPKVQVDTLEAERRVATIAAMLEDLMNHPLPGGRGGAGQSGSQGGGGGEGGAGAPVVDGPVGEP